MTRLVASRETLCHSCIIRPYLFIDSVHPAPEVVLHPILEAALAAEAVASDLALVVIVRLVDSWQASQTCGSFGST